MDLCLAAERRPGSQVDKRLSYQEGLDLEGMWTANREAEQEEGEDKKDRTGWRQIRTTNYVGGYFSKRNIRDRSKCSPCLCSGIDTLPSKYEYT